MNASEIKELIRAHLDAGVDIDIPDEEIRRACKPEFDRLNARLDAIEGKPAAKIVRLDMIRAAAKTANTRHKSGKGRIAA